jgi:hypothetical protein
VTPRARQEGIAGWRSGRLQVRTAAPPLDDRANDAVRRLLAGTLGISPSRIHLTRGLRGRDKIATVYGLSAEEVTRRLRGEPGH